MLPFLYIIVYIIYKIQSELVFDKLRREYFIDYYKEVEEECKFLGTLEVYIFNNRPYVKVNDMVRYLINKYNPEKAFGINLNKFIEYELVSAYYEMENFKLIKKMDNPKMGSICDCAPSELKQGDILLIILTFQFNYLKELNCKSY